MPHKMIKFIAKRARSRRQWLWCDCLIWGDDWTCLGIGGGVGVDILIRIISNNMRRIHRHIRRRIVHRGTIVPCCSDNVIRVSRSIPNLDIKLVAFFVRSHVKNCIIFFHEDSAGVPNLLDIWHHRPEQSKIAILVA